MHTPIPQTVIVTQEKHLVLTTLLPPFFYHYYVSIFADMYCIYKCLFLSLRTVLYLVSMWFVAHQLDPQSGSIFPVATRDYCLSVCLTETANLRRKYVVGSVFESLATTRAWIVVDVQLTVSKPVPCRVHTSLERYCVVNTEGTPQPRLNTASFPSSHPAAF